MTEHGWREGLPSRKKCANRLSFWFLHIYHSTTQNRWEQNPIPSHFWAAIRLTPMWVRVCIHPHWCKPGGISKTAGDRIWLSTILSNIIFGHSDFVLQCIGTFFLVQQCLPPTVRNIFQKQPVFSMNWAYSLKVFKACFLPIGLYALCFCFVFCSDSTLDFH